MGRVKAYAHNIITYDVLYLIPCCNVSTFCLSFYSFKTIIFDGLLRTRKKLVFEPPTHLHK